MEGETNDIVASLPIGMSDLRLNVHQQYHGGF